MAYSISEENYLKSIYLIAQRTNALVSTSAIASDLNTTPASVTDMIKKLADKDLIEYEPYRGVKLTASGRQHANLIVRKHRLWETFLHDKLQFDWDEVHDIAEQLEHIQSQILVDRLDDFLGNPKFDPHGDPIPDKYGRFTLRAQHRLFDVEVGSTVRVVGVSDHDAELLQHLKRLEINIGTHFDILKRYDFDDSIEISISNGAQTSLSRQVQEHVVVQYMP